VLFVCLGNVCRSPSAAGVFRRLVEQAGLAGRIEVESAGTGGHFAGRPPDPRAVRAAARRGIELAGRARQVTRDDFARCDLVVAMDAENLAALRALRPEGARARVEPFLVGGGGGGASGSARSVPDPFYGDEAGFERLLDLLEAGAPPLLARLRREHGL